jgi:hypothetical protein
VQRPILARTGVLSLVDRPPSKLSFLATQRHLKTLDLTGTPFESLDDLQPQPILSNLLVDKCANLSSFLGLDRHPRLAQLSALETPLAARPRFRVAALIVVGPHLSTLNRTPITRQEREEAKAYPAIVKHLLLAGRDLEDRTHDEFREIAIERGIEVNGRRFEDLDPAEASALLGPRPAFIPRTRADDERELGELEKQEQKAARKSEAAERELADRLAEQLGRIGVRVNLGPSVKDEILAAVTALTDVVKLLDEGDEQSPQEEEQAPEAAEEDTETRDPPVLNTEPE